MADGDALIGKSVGNYRLQQRLGVGGMGAVYLGEHPEIHSRVAIKVLLPRFVENAPIVHRFLDEARAVNRIDHPGIVRIHDCGRQEGVGVYLVMELLEGKTFREHLHAEGPFAEERVVRLLRQTASALAASHQAGIIHRDLKPANLFLVCDPDLPGGERVKILDFGIAKLLEDREAITHESTQTGMVLGSPLFMAPEQCIDPKRVDGRADIYSLGAIGYHLLTGKYPFEADTLGQLILNQQQGEPAALRSLRPEIAPALESILHRALAVVPEERFATMGELRDAMGELLGLQGSPSARARPLVASGSEPRLATTTLSGTAGEQLALHARGARARLMVGAALVLALIGGGLVVWRAGTREETLGAATRTAPPITAPAVDATPPVAVDLAVARDRRPPDATPHAQARKKQAPRTKSGSKTARPLADRPAPKAEDKTRSQGQPDGAKKQEKKPYFDEL